MNDNNLVKKLIQARTIEATKKNINSKLVCIARNYGSPIIGHYYDSHLVDEDWNNYEGTDWSQVQEADESGTLPRLGFIYDSLKLGVNVEIVVLAKETKINGKRELEKPTRVKCNYKGYTVYHEEDGKLMSYAPFPEWETHIDKVYEKASGSDSRRIEEEKKEELDFKRKAASKVLSSIRKLWGI